MVGLEAMFTYHSFGFLLNPVFLRAFAASFHLAFLFLLSISWACQRIKEGGLEIRKRISFPYYKQTFACCLGLSAFNFVLCFLNYFYCYENGWSDETRITLLDSVTRTLAWGTLCLHLHIQFIPAVEPRFPFLLRVWWGFYFSISFYCLVINIVKKHQSVRIQFLVPDTVYVIIGLFLCYSGFLGKNQGEQPMLREPLLNGSASISRAGSDKAKGEATVTPFSEAGFFSILTFAWISPLIAEGYKKTLDLEDVPQLDTSNSIIGVFPEFRNKLHCESGGSGGVTKLKLVKALLSSSRAETLLTAIFLLLSTLASYVGPYLMESFVQYLSGRRELKNEGYLLVLAFFAANLVECLSLRHLYFRMQQVEMRIKSILMTSIYNKGLTLSYQSKQDHSTGDIINLISVDAERVGSFCWYVHDPWILIIQITLGLLILYKNLGLASVVAFFASVIVMWANRPLGQWQEKYQDKLMESRGKRMGRTAEILRNMKILKLQGWEMKFLSKIVDLRKYEEGWLKKCLHASVVASFVFGGALTSVPVITFGTCIILRIPLEAGKILSSIATFKILQEPIGNLPDLISRIAETKVSLDRISSFLHLDDLQSDAIERLPSGSTDTAIEIVDGNFSWDLSSPNPTLKDINLLVCHGMRVAICGTVGSGKSSLLSSMLGEVPKISGIVKTCGTKAYVVQSPWIQSGKIEENILFGKGMDREWYERVLDACSLKKDLEFLSFGDQTVIGERGINLSGGQKQRIQIARALYQNADMYLFDDPFSAVDAHTGTHIFKECLLGLLDSKTVIYVTHQVEFLAAADLILVMKDGRIKQAGKYNEILNSGTDFMELVGAHKKALSALNSAEATSFSEKVSIHEDNDNISGTSEVAEKEESSGKQNGQSEEIGGPKGQLVQEEEREKGKVGFSVYWKYITTAYGGALAPFLLFTQILLELLQIGSNYWMAWASSVSVDLKPVVKSSTLMIVYVALAVGSSFCVLSRGMLLATTGYKTATILFNKMHFCIFRAPMSFFDATPSGRILNRASTDQRRIDTAILGQISSFAFSFIQVLGIIAVMSQVAWQVFVVFIPVVATCIWYQQYYAPSARELSRLCAVCEAPVIQHFSETISGSMTIRSFEQESRFRDTNMKLVDGFMRPQFSNAAGMEWLCFRLDMLSSITFAFSLVFLISVPDGVIDPGIAGLAVSYGLNLSVIQSWMISNLCNMETEMISVERIFQYTSIPSEAPLIIEENRPPCSWPSHGEVDIKDLQVRYAPHMPLVLKGLTCTLPGGMKTGIVGRTGSGKSTLIQTLFRIMEPASGRIMIDGINILSIGLHDLRSRLSIIPQDPTMFDGTVKSNIDPLEEYSDEQIWEALDKCQLGDEVRKKEGKLDSAVTENGENWSMGQRQLVCLGRVLLKKSKVLVLDEATASVDTATDNFIQQTISQHFVDSTVITIAHRITSVLDSDTVLLLDHGLIEEYGNPTRLLENKSSSFAKLVSEYTARSNFGLENAVDT